MCLTFCYKLLCFEPHAIDESIKIRVRNSLIGFSSNSLVFCEQNSDSLVTNSESLPLLFCHEQPSLSKLLRSHFCHQRPQGIAHGRSLI